MNESPDDLSADEIDQTLADWLSPLKSLSPPLEARVANRAAIAGELRKMAAEAETRVLPWWRRSISVPLPLAAGLAALLLVALLIPLRGIGDPRGTTSPRLQPTQWSSEPRVAPAAPASIVHRQGATNAAREYYETEVYLCGVGRLSSESGYLIREQ